MGFENLNYWQRLSEAKLFSIQRRNERFRILYTWKSLYGKVPSLGFKLKSTLRNGRFIIQDNDIHEKGISASVRRDSIFTMGPYLFNVLPVCIRNIDEDYAKFKTVLDIFLSQIPDCPVMKGYITHNYDNNNRQTNSLIYWIRNMKLGNWMDTRIGQHADT